MPPTPKDSIASSLDRARKELLDLGLRNSLLNYRTPTSRGVDIAGGDADQVYRWLVAEGKELLFRAVDESEGPTTADAAGEGAGTPKAGRARAAASLATHLTDKALQARLLGTYHAAVAHIEERGANILFLALGMLHWFEDDSSQKSHRAPILLIPVQLERTSAREKFRLSYNDEDIDDNLSLATKLRTEFRIDYPAMPEAEDLAPAAYAAAVAQATAGMARWRVEADEIALGFFSFGKFLMYRDLDPQAWVTQDNPDGSALLTALLKDGFRQEPSPVGEDEYLDPHIAPDKLHQVVDMDSSQALALLDIRGGRNLVIQGPPGTGKSQTITNVIADALGRGQKVLFVAEKMAALDVVKRRLDQAGIGDACLELHSHTANKKALLEDLRRTMQLGRPQLPGGRFGLAQYTLLRDQLTDYSEAVNTPVGDSDYTPFQLMGELVAIGRRLGDVALPRLGSDRGAGAAVQTLTREKITQLSTPVTGLARHLTTMGVPAQHPFRGSGLLALLPTDRQDLAHALQDFASSAQELSGALTELSSFMGIAARLDAAEAQVLVNAGQRAMTAPHLRHVRINTEAWQQKRDQIVQLLNNGAGLAALHTEFDAVLIPEAWSADLLESRQVLRTTGQAWWRWMSGDYRRTRNRIKGLCIGESRSDVASQLALVEAVLQAARQNTVVSEHAALGAELFGVQWQGLQSDWSVLGRINDWVVELYRAIGDREVPQGILDFLAGNPSVDSLRTRVDALEAALPAFASALPRVVDLLQLDTVAQKAFKTSSLEDQLAQVVAWQGAADRLPQWITYNNAVAVVRRTGLDWLVEQAYSWVHAGKHLTSLFQHDALERLLRLAHAQRQALRGFSSASQDQVRSEFVELDRAGFAATQLHLATQHWTALPKTNGHGQVGLLQREFEKRARHLPIRKLMLSAGNAIQAIKPVFMMSPMSVASFLPPGSIGFDLVIFDEASQVKPVDALGAVLRGKQLVVVGDSKQLPPTSFFDTLAADGDADDGDDEPLATSDMESILGLVAGQGAPQRMLRWHYRSRHESLIALSNKEYYDSRLVVFPSPEPQKNGLGLVFRHLPASVYDRGRSRTNRKEAQAVALAVMQHARTAPQRSLGVAAFSLAQTNAIQDEVERLRAADPALEAFFSRHPFEPFFVKNLESVQGDERDVIFISVGYGKDEKGYLAMSFGALNGNGGERRLNVLISRARLSCEVFSNLTHDEIDLARTASRGVAGLKAYLKYAATGLLDVPDLERDEQDSVFEEEVADALEFAGQQVASQVGSGGFRIDLAVIDPGMPGRYLLGIECDGATYHSSRSARDRDRLRQQVLEGLGWRIHRIWSTDWFADPAAELRRVLAAIEQAKVVLAPALATADVALSMPAPAVSEAAPALAPTMTRQALPTAPAVELVGKPYLLATPMIRLGNQDLHEVAPATIGRWAAEVAATESPVHVREVMRRITEGCGVKRIGARIEAALQAGFQRAANSGLLQLRGNFIWLAAGGDAEVRDRSLLPAASRKIEFIAPEEIAVAILGIVDASYGIAADEVPTAVCRMLGFGRTTEDMIEVIGVRVEDLISSSAVVLADGMLQRAT